MSRLKASAIILMCVTVGSYLGKLYFIFELASHYRVHFAVLLVLLVLLFGLHRQGKWVVAALIAACINLVEIIPWYAAENTFDDSAASLSVLVSNVQVDNREYERLLRQIDREQPDILGLLEVDSRWLENLASVRRRYEYRLEYPRDDMFGLAFYSKLPFREADVVYFGDAATPSIVATLESGPASFEFILAHLNPPLGRDMSARRNRQLRRIGQHIAVSDESVLLAGDLNTTVWSPYYKEFEQLSGMNNARAGHGIGATFPPLPLLGIGIDHILVTPPSSVGDFRVHEGIGSDHRPISARVSMAPRH